MKLDEQLLLAELARLGWPRENYATEVAASLGINAKRAEYILGKWADRRWWEYGVSLRTGWLTDAGIAAARSLA